jgi:hypothetical protein
MYCVECFETVTSDMLRACASCRLPLHPWPGLTRCKLPPEGAVLALHEIKADSTKETVGTLVIFTRSGKCVTALHCICWNGKVYPDALEAGGFKLQYLQGFPEDDIAVLQLLSSAPPNSHGGSAGSWPYVPAGSVSRGTCGTTHSQCREPSVLVSLIWLLAFFSPIPSPP